MPNGATKLSRLGEAVSTKRIRDGLSLREAAGEAQVSFNTLARVEKGHIPDLETFVRLAAWAGVPPERFFERRIATSESTPEAIAAHLKADAALTSEAADKIASILTDLYRAFARPTAPTVMHLRASRTFKPEAVQILGDILASISSGLSKGAG